MNGSENGYSGALFFSLISLGALLKIDDVVGWIIGAVAAIFAAISLRRAFVQSAQAAEEDHQRIEIQLQQLWSKVSETSAINVEAMNAVIDSAQLLQENLQVIRVRLAELDNLTQLTRNSEALLASVGSLEENSSALNAELEKFFADIQSQEKPAELEPVTENLSELADELKKITAIEEANRTSLQTVLKFLQLVGQMLKTPTYKKEFDKINQSLEKISARATELDALKTSLDAAQKNLAELVKINATFSKNLSKTNSSKNPPEDVAISEQDINLLKKIAAKINLK